MAIEELIIENLRDFLYDKVEEVKKIILSDYAKLEEFIIDKRSVVDINLFRNEFKTVLDNFDFIREEDGPMEFVVPSTESLKFNNLSIIHQILEGVVGEYLEVNIDTINILKNIDVSNRIPIDGTNIYLLKSTNELRSILENLGEPLIIFPFSGTGPLDDFVFSQAHKYVDNNMGKWIDQVIEDTKKTMEQGV